MNINKQYPIDPIDFIQFAENDVSRDADRLDAMRTWRKALSTAPNPEDKSPEAIVGRMSVDFTKQSTANRIERTVQ